MKALSMLLALVVAAVASRPGNVAPAPETYDIDSVHSFALFKIKHMNVGYAWGRFNEPSGTIVVDAASAAGSSVSVELKTDNVDTGNAKRDQHLKGADFFNAKQFPAITFKSKSVKANGDAAFEVAGDLTLMGVAKPLTVTLTRIGSGKDPMGGMRTGFEGSFTIKRSDFGMKQFLDTLGDEVQITLAIQGVLKK